MLERTLRQGYRLGTHRGRVQGEVFSRKAQLIKCWLVSREVDGVDKIFGQAKRLSLFLPKSLTLSRIILSNQNTRFTISLQSQLDLNRKQALDSSLDPTRNEYLP